MHNTTFALAVLAMFTTAERAAEIEGDLLEQSRTRGRLWFWWQVKLTCIVLFFYGLRQEAGKLLLISYAVYELVLKLNWLALNPLRFALWRGLDLDNSQLPVMHNFVNSSVAFSLAMLVTRLSPRHGGYITLLAGGFMFGRIVLLDGAPFVPRFVVFVLLPAISGALLMKWLELRHRSSDGIAARRH
jgi:hypothetical protein